MRARLPSTATPTVPGGGGLGLGPHLWAQSAEQRRGARSGVAPHCAPAPSPAPLRRSLEDAPATGRTGPPHAASYFRNGALATKDATPTPRLLPGSDFACKSTPSARDSALLWAKVPEESAVQPREPPNFQGPERRTTRVEA